MPASGVPSGGGPRNGVRTGAFVPSAAQQNTLDRLSTLAIAPLPERHHRLDAAAADISDLLGGDTAVITLVTGNGEFLDTYGVHHPDPEVESSFRDCVGARTRVGDGYTTRVAA